MKSKSETVTTFQEDRQQMIDLLKKVEKKLVGMYDAITKGHGEAFAAEDELVKEIRDFLKDVI